MKIFCIFGHICTIIPGYGWYIWATVKTLVQKSEISPIARNYYAKRFYSMSNIWKYGICRYKYGTFIVEFNHIGVVKIRGIRYECSLICVEVKDTSHSCVFTAPQICKIFSYIWHTVITLCSIIPGYGWFIWLLHKCFYSSSNMVKYANSSYKYGTFIFEFPLDIKYSCRLRCVYIFIYI